MGREITNRGGSSSCGDTEDDLVHVSHRKSVRKGTLETEKWLKKERSDGLAVEEKGATKKNTQIKERGKKDGKKLGRFQKADS